MREVSWPETMAAMTVAAYSATSSADPMTNVNLGGMNTKSQTRAARTPAKRTGPLPTLRLRPITVRRKTTPTGR
jgi:hypothetical protein